MSRRIEIELTSARPDGVWTWRAAGAREPKGTLDGSLLPEGTKAGDVLRVEVDSGIDGIEVLAVLPSRQSRREPDRLELLSGGSFEPVTQQLARPGRPPRRDRRDDDRPRRGPRPERPGGAERRPRQPRPEGERSGDRPPRPRSERPRRPSHPPVPEVPQRPKPKRLRAGRAYRTEFLNELPEEHKPVAEQLLRGGMPAVRQAIDEQNARLRAEDKPEIKQAGVVALAEQLLPRARVAEWLDRAHAALAEVAELDLRDLRSVVAAAGDPVVARDDRTTDLADQLRDALGQRQEKEHADWLGDIVAALDVGRVVRALRLSSRPPKAGVPFPPDLATRLAEGASAALAGDASGERWVAVLEAVAYSPVHAQVAPVGVPEPVPDEVRSVTNRLAGLVPEVARRLGIEPPPPGSPMPRPPRTPRKAATRTKPRGARPAGPPPPPPTDTADTAAPRPERAPAPEPPAAETAPAGAQETPDVTTAPEAATPEPATPEPATPEPADAPAADVPEAPAPEVTAAPAPAAPEVTAAPAPAAPAAASPEPEAATPEPAAPEVTAAPAPAAPEAASPEHETERPEPNGEA